MKLLLVNASVREGRATPKVFNWVKHHADALEGAEIATVDLKEVGLPMFSEPAIPMSNQDRNPEGPLKVWLDAVAAADALVIVTPEYNHAMPASLKNAIDYIDFQVMKKPFMVVGHGGVGGARAIEQVKLSLNSNLGGVPVHESVNVVGFPLFQNLLSDDGEPQNEDIEKLGGSLDSALQTTVWYAGALKAAKEA